MINVLVPIDRAGRIVLPKGVRQELGIQSGDVFKVSVLGNVVTLMPEKARSGFVRKGKALVFSAQNGTVLDQATVNSLIEASREESVGCLPGKLVPKKSRS